MQCYFGVKYIFIGCIYLLRCYSVCQIDVFRYSIAAGLLFWGTFCFGKNTSFSSWECQKFHISKGGKASLTTDGFLKLQYDPAQSKFTEYHFLKSKDLGYFERVGIYFKLEKSEKRTARIFSVRLADRDGEVFQFSRNINSGTNRVAFEIDLKNFKHNGNWGGKEKANKKFDLPARIVGIALHCFAKDGKGDLFISSLDIDKQDAYANWSSFTSFANYMFYTSGCSIDIAGYPEALRITYPAARDGNCRVIFNKRIPLGSFRRGSVIVNTDALEATSFSSAALTLRDSEGELFAVRSNNPKKGNMLIFDFDAENPPESFAENKHSKLNKKIDFPVEVQQISLRYPASGDTQELKIYSIHVDRTSGPQSFCLSDSKPKVVNGKFTFPINGKVQFPLICEGQLRLKVKGNRKDFVSAELACKSGKLYPSVRFSALENVKTDSYEVIFPVPYAMRSSNILLRSITVKSKSAVTPLSICHEDGALHFSLSVGKGTPVSSWRENSNGFAVLTSRMAEKTVEGKLRFSIFDDQKKEYFKFDKTITIAPNERMEIPLPVPPRFGIWHITGTMPGENGKTVFFQRRFGYMQEVLPEKHDGMQYGIIMLTPYLPRCDRGILGISLAGADVNRSSFIWSDIERQRGKWNWNYVDRYMNISRKHNVRVAPILWCPPRWATAKDWKPTYLPIRSRFGFPPPDLDLWEIYIRNCVKRYGKEVRVMEIWNEAELSGFANFTPEEYAELLKRAYKVIKEERPEIEVSTCGYTCLPGGHPGMNFPDFMPRSLKAAKGSYDIHSIHLHSFFPEYAADIKTFLKLRKDWGVSVPWAANETAITSTFCSRQQQAEIMFEKVVFSKAYGAGAYIWHNAIDLARDPANKEHNFGVIDNAFEPKHVFVAFAATVKLLRNAKFCKDFTKNDRHIYHFRNGREQFFTMWSFYPPSAEKAVIFSNIKGKVFWSDIYGNRTPLNVKSGKLLLKITSTPGILIFSAAEKPVFEGELIEAAEAALTWKVPKPELVKNISVKINGKDIAGILKDNQFKFEYNTRGLRKRVPYDLMLDTVWGKMKLRAFLMPRSEFPAQKNFDRPADFVLESKESYDHRAPADPDYADQYWKGPHDCSAEIWMGLEKNDISIKVRVVDNIHHQTRISAVDGIDRGTLNMWREDSLQLLFLRTETGGFWKIGVGLDNNGKVGTHIWNIPEKLKNELSAVQKQIKAQVVRDEKNKTTTYQVVLPAEKIGVVIGKNFRFNVLVNDNDGRIRVGYHALASTQDDGKNDTGYPRIKFVK